MKRFAAVLLALLVPAIGAAKDCSKADAANAEKALDRVVNWQGMQKAWQDYGHCDTGPVGEAFTEALLRLTVAWQNVDALAKAMNDPKYKEFVIAHLRSPEAKGDYDAIYSRTKANCPKNLDGFCTDLREALKPASAAEPDKPLDLQPLKPLK
jgi:hypothetical protein